MYTNQVFKSNASDKLEQTTILGYAYVILAPIYIYALPPQNQFCAVVQYMCNSVTNKELEGCFPILLSHPPVINSVHVRLSDLVGS